MSGHRDGYASYPSSSSSYHYHIPHPPVTAATSSTTSSLAYQPQTSYSSHHSHSQTYPPYNDYPPAIHSPPSSSRYQDFIPPAHSNDPYSSYSNHHPISTSSTSSTYYPSTSTSAYNHPSSSSSAYLDPRDRDRDRDQRDRSYSSTAYPSRHPETDPYSRDISSRDRDWEREARIRELDRERERDWEYRERERAGSRPRERELSRNRDLYPPSSSRPVAGESSNSRKRNQTYPNPNPGIEEALLAMRKKGDHPNGNGNGTPLSTSRSSSVNPIQSQSQSQKTDRKVDVGASPRIPDVVAVEPAAKTPVKQNSSNHSKQPVGSSKQEFKTPVTNGKQKEKENPPTTNQNSSNPSEPPAASDIAVALGLMIELAKLNISPLELIQQYDIDREVVRACCSEVGIDLKSVESEKDEKKKKEILDQIASFNKDEGKGKEGGGGSSSQSSSVIEIEEGEIDRNAIKSERRDRDRERKKRRFEDYQEDEDSFDRDRDENSSSRSRNGKERSRRDRDREEREREREKSSRKLSKKERKRERERERDRERDRDRSKRNDRDKEDSSPTKEKKSSSSSRSSKDQSRSLDKITSSSSLIPSTGSLSSFFNPAFGPPNLALPLAGMSSTSTSTSNPISSNQNPIDLTNSSSPISNQPSSIVVDSPQSDLMKKMREAALASMKLKKKKSQSTNVSNETLQRQSAPPTNAIAHGEISLLNRVSVPEDENSDMDLDEDPETTPNLGDTSESNQVSSHFPIAMRSHPSLPPRPAKKKSQKSQEFIIPTTTNSVSPSIAQLRALPAAPNAVSGNGQGGRKTRPSLEVDPRAGRQNNLSYSDDFELDDIPTGEVDLDAPLPSLTSISSFLGSEESKKDSKSSISVSIPSLSTRPSGVPQSAIRRRPVASDFDTPQKNLSSSTSSTFKPPEPFLKSTITSIVIGCDEESEEEEEDIEDSDDEDSEAIRNSRTRRLEYANKMYAIYKEKHGIEDPPPPSTRNLASQVQSSRGGTPSDSLLNQKEMEIKAAKEKLAALERRRKGLNAAINGKNTTTTDSINGENVQSINSQQVHLLIENAIQNAHDRSPLPSPEVEDEHLDFDGSSSNQGTPDPTSLRSYTAEEMESNNSTMIKLEAALQAEKALLAAAIEAQGKKSMTNGVESSSKRKASEPLMDSENHNDGSSINGNGNHNVNGSMDLDETLREKREALLAMMKKKKMKQLVSQDSEGSSTPQEAASSTQAQESEASSELNTRASPSSEKEVGIEEEQDISMTDFKPFSSPRIHFGISRSTSASTDKRLCKKEANGRTCSKLNCQNAHLSDFQ